MTIPESPISSVQVTNPEELASAIRSATFEPCLLERTASASQLTRLLCPRVCLDFASLGASFLFKGIMANDCFTVIFILECPRPGKSFNFEVEHQGGYVALFPPGSILDSYSPAGYSNASLTVPTDLFLAAVERFFPEIPDHILKRGTGVRVKASSQLPLRRLLETVKTGIHASEPSYAGAAARAELESQLLDGFLYLLREAVEEKGPRLKRRTGDAEKHLRSARDFLNATMHRPLHLDELCAELEMSRRGVEMLFRKALGTTPGIFLQRQRLNGSRRDLLNGDAASTSVSEVALKWGLFHMGHFSKNYRDLFGECPSTTLRRGH